MKTDIHPTNYRQVIFEDIASGESFLIGSTVRTNETGTFEGKEYPKVIVEISSKSHPFYTGEERTLDKTGRVERFRSLRKLYGDGSRCKSGSPSQHVCG